MTMSMWLRAAAVLAAVLFLGAVAATFLPTSPQGATCGTWVAPEWDDESTQRLLDRAGVLREGAGIDPSGELGAEVAGLAASVSASKRLCDDALSTRRTVALVLLGAAVLVPAGVLFVGAGRREAL